MGKCIRAFQVDQLYRIAKDKEFIIKFAQVGGGKHGIFWFFIYFLSQGLRPLCYCAHKVEEFKMRQMSLGWSHSFMSNFLGCPLAIFCRIGILPKFGACWVSSLFIKLLVMRINDVEAEVNTSYNNNNNSNNSWVVKTTTIVILHASRNIWEKGSEKPKMSKMKIGSQDKPSQANIQG